MLIWKVFLSQSPSANKREYRLSFNLAFLHALSWQSQKKLFSPDVVHTRLPGIHPTINNWIIHGITHCKPVNSQVNLLNVFGLCYLRVIGCEKKVDVLWSPTHSKNHHNDHHHKHNLETEKRENTCNWFGCLRQFLFSFSNPES